MRQHLALALGGAPPFKTSKGTISALATRDLVNLDGSLTQNGWIQAVVHARLVDQCEKLGIGFEEVEGFSYHRKPERAAFEYYQDIGYTGAYCEGGAILLLIRAAALDVLAELSPFSSRKDAMMRFTEAQFTILSEHIPRICDTVRTASTDAVVDAFEEIYGSEDIRDWYPGLTAAAFGRLFEGIGGETLSKIAAVIAEAPYDYRNGWPDLTLINERNDIRWIEVKTTDKLHQSQVATLRRMKSLMPGTVSVTRLR